MHADAVAASRLCPVEGVIRILYEFLKRKGGGVLEAGFGQEHDELLSANARQGNDIEDTAEPRQERAEEENTGLFSDYGC